MHSSFGDVQFEALSNFIIASHPILIPGSSDILVSNEAVALNPASQLLPSPLSSLISLDFVDIVVKVGAGVTSLN